MRTCVTYLSRLKKPFPHVSHLFFISSQAILRQSGDYLDLIANSESRDLLRNLLPSVIRTLSDLMTMEANTQHVPLANPNPSNEGARDSKRARLS